MNFVAKFASCERPEIVVTALSDPLIREMHLPYISAVHDPILSLPRTLMADAVIV